MTDPNPAFTVVYYANPNDPANDLQTGQPDADIVGDATNPGFLTGFDGTYVYYRVRLGATITNHNGYFWVGVDGNTDGTLDLFVGVDNQGSNTQLEFVAPGTGANNSPSTTSIGNLLAQYTLAQTTDNYYYTAVNSTLQPGITNTDLNADGRTDAFLTLRLSFFGAPGTATLQGAMSGIAGIDINATSPLGYVIATSTQRNSLNQDIGGVNNKTLDKSLSWLVLGAMPVVDVDGDIITPEPAAFYQIAGGLALVAVALRRKRRQTSLG